MKDILWVTQHFKTDSIQNIQIKSVIEPNASCQYFAENKLDINADKTKRLHFNLNK